MLTPYAQQTMVDAMPIAACVFTGPEHTISAVNTDMLTIWAKDHTACGKTLHDAIPEIRGQGFSELLTKVFTTGQEYHNPYGSAVLVEGGQEKRKHFDFSFKPLRDKDGVIYGVVNTALDTTERTVAQDKLQQTIEELNASNEEQRSTLEELRATNEYLEEARISSVQLHRAAEDNEARLHNILDTMAEGLALFDASGKTYYLNHAAHDMLGLPHNSVQSRNYNDSRWMNLRPDGTAIPPEEHPIFEALRSGKPAMGREVLVEMPSGRRLNVSINASPVHDLKGRLTGGVATFMDITEQRQNEAVQRKLKTLVDNSADLMSLLELDGTNSYMNNAGKQLLGFESDEEVRTTPIADLHAPEHFAKVEREVIPSAMSKGHWEGNMQVRHLKTGEVFPVSSYTIRIDDPATGVPLAIGAIMRDLRPELDAQKALADSRHQLEQMILTAPVGMCILKGYDLVVQMANEPMLKIWTRSSEQIIGKRLMEVFPELEGQPFPQMLYNVLDTGDPLIIPEITADIAETSGEMNRLYISIAYHRLLDSTGNPEAIMATVINLTDTVKARQALHESEQQLQQTNEELTALNEEYVTLNEALNATNIQLAESEDRLNLAISSADMGTWTLDLTNQHVTWDDRTKQLYGFSKDDQVDYEQVLQYMHPDDRAIVDAAVMQALDPASGGYYDIRFRTVGAEDNQVRWLHCKGRAYFNEQGQPYRFSGTAQDVSAEKEAQEALKHANQKVTESEQRLRKIFDQAPLALSFLSGPDQRFELVNNRLLELINKDQSIIGKTYAEVRPEPEVAPFLHLMRQVYDSGKPFVATEQKVFINQTRAEQWGYFNFTYQPIKDGHGNTTSILSIAEDVTETMKVRRENERVSRQLQIAVEAAQIGSWQVDARTMELDYSSTLASLLGYQAAEPLTYKLILEQVAPDYREAMHLAVEHALNSGGDYDFSYPQRRFDNGEELWVRSVGKVLTGTDGTPVALTGVLMDITEQKRQEQRKADFIGIASHELRSPLTALKGYLQIAQVKTEKSGDMTTLSLMQKSDRQVQRMQGLIKGFLDVARFGEGKIQLNLAPFDLANLMKLAESESLASHSTHKIIYHPVEYTPVLADHDKIEQVLVNFVNNAVKYSSHGSTINVACVTREGKAYVSVQDEGLGIASKDLLHVFDRFYRVESPQTKLIKGFGIGLYICREIIELHKGHIGANSELGKGSEFWFELPVNLNLNE